MFFNDKEFGAVPIGIVVLIIIPLLIIFFPEISKLVIVLLLFFFVGRWLYKGFTEKDDD